MIRFRSGHVRNIWFVVMLAVAGSASAALLQSTSNQTGSVPFTPTWTPSVNSLIAGVSPGSALGNFSQEADGRDVNALTAGGSLTIDSITVPDSTCSTNYVTCGNASDAGSTLIYTLPASEFGYDLTNITVYGGWQDSGRDAQAYTVYYSTIVNPDVFMVLDSVNYNPSVTGGVASATQVILSDSAGQPIATNVAAVKFDFTSPASENGYTGYGAITMEGMASTNVTLSSILVTMETENNSSSFTPVWSIEADSLIAGQLPSMVGAGNFTTEGAAGVAVLTDGTFGGVADFAEYATCGNAAGQSVTYFLNGASLTNIVVYSGWQDVGRDGQFYNITYSTVDAPASFIALTSINYNPSVSGVAANRIGITSPAGEPLATNVAYITFDFTPQESSSDNGYSGYAEIVLQGLPGAGGMNTGAAMQTLLPASAADSADAVLTFNEIMYHPPTDEAGMEWVEFYNQLAVDVDISGWSVSGDTDYTFPDGTRVAGRSYIVLARTPEDFQAATGISSNLFGPFVSPLDNQGGTLELRNRSGRLMDRLDFGTMDDWPVIPDGAGPSLAKIDPDWGTMAPANWAASREKGGTPGTENFVSTVPPVPVVFNEVAGTTEAVFWVELLNCGTNSVALDNCILHHDGVSNTDYLFPAGVTINGGSFLVLSNETLGFVDPAPGEKLFLFAPGEADAYDGFVLKKGLSARHAYGTGEWLVPDLPTPGGTNHFTFHSELVINEIMYSHQDIPAAEPNGIPQDNPEEWIELYNRGSNVVDLTGWALSGGISFPFTAGRTIAPGGYLVVAKDAVALRAGYPAADVVGDYSGRLGGEETIVLEDPLGNPADEVHYYGDGRWPAYASGGGSSLELRDPGADNSNAAAWAASHESDKSSWETYTYRMVAQASATAAPDSQWRDFVLGLLGGGECWVDDLSVVQSPTNNPVQLIANGDFENGMADWRALGTHRNSAVETDPDQPGNHVLHLVATGAQEHMHNHLEQTLANGAGVVNGELYEISYRARWINGNNLLNTRLYFNRVARSSALDVPQSNGTPGAVNSCYAGNIGPTFTQFQHQPVVPQPGLPVSVFVKAQDPQDVAACDVWWSVNGGAWLSAPMTLTNGVYAGSIPGGVTGNLVQFYVQAEDGLGAVSTYPANGRDSGAFYRVNDGAAQMPPAHIVRILMSPADVALQYATTNLMSNESLPCTVIYDERQAYYDMSVRLKSSQRGRVEAGRIGFHLEFNPDDLFRGVHPVMLLDRSTGGSRPPGEEMLLKHMLLQSGVPAVNSDYCQVIAPQSAQNGMAILSPRFEDRFVETAFKNGGDGQLHELELTYYPLTADANGYKLPAPDSVQGVDISDLGNDKETYRYNFILKNHRRKDDYTTLINFARKWSLSGAELDVQTQSTMDVDEWLRAYAMMSLGGVGDMYTFGNNHNLMMYIRPDDGKVLYFPWDMDFLFSQSTASSLVGDQNLSRIVNLPGNLRRFYAYILDAVSSTYNAAYMAYWADHYGAIFGQDYSGDLSYIAARGSYALNVIDSAGGNADFSVNGADSFTASSNLVVLSGTAPVAISTLLVNGISYPVTWDSISSWTVQVPISSGTNVLNIQAFDLHGNLVADATKTSVFSGSVPPPDQVIVINEIMSRPAMANGEYIELFNTSGTTSYDLSGWRLNGLDYTFPSGTIFPPNSYLVLAEDRVAYANAYGNTRPLFDQFDGTLDPEGETLTLFRPDPVVSNQYEVVDRVRYEATVPWPTATNGVSAQLIDAAQDNSRAGNWGAVDDTASAQWVHVSATGIPRASATLRPLYIYLQSAGDIYIDDVCVVAGSVADAGVNLVPNGGFETGFSPWTIGSDGNNSASTISSGFKHSGTNSLQLIAASGGTTQASSIWQDFSSTLTVGETYTLSFWYRQTTSGAPLTVRFSGSGIVITEQSTNAAQLLTATPAAANSVAATIPAFPSVWLNELQAENLTGPTDHLGQRAPWIELANAGTNDLSLAGLYLSDNYTNLTQWAFPSDCVVPANGSLVVWCDGQTNASTADAPHAGFSLTAGAGQVALARFVEPDQPQLVDYLSYTNLSANWSYGDYPDAQPFYRRQMFVATPGALNTNTSPPISVVINEWMADNGHTLANPLGGGFDDWFELYNSGTNTVDLGGYYLTDDLENRTKFLIPDNGHYQVEPGAYLLVWADNNDSLNDINDADLHAGFSLSKSGEYLGLFAEDGTAIDVITFGAQTADVSQGRFPDGAGNIFLMPTPTPRAQNVIPNTAPKLSVINNRFIYIGQTVQFTAVASDEQDAYQALTFTLASAPAGASIDPSSGVCEWTALNVAAPSTNAITVRVTDDGLPPMSDEKTVLVYVLPPLQFNEVIPLQDGYVQISFDSLPGCSYQLQFKNNLTDDSWTSLDEVLSGDGASMSVYDDSGGQPHRFFRLLVLP